MRIIGEFDLDQIKVTVFTMNERISVKYEYDLMEQTYKFRDGSGIKTVDDVVNFSNGDVSKEIKRLFTDMATLRIKGIQNINSQVLDAFDEIL